MQKSQLNLDFKQNTNYFIYVLLVHLKFKLNCTSCILSVKSAKHSSRIAKSVCTICPGCALNLWCDRLASAATLSGPRFLCLKRGEFGQRPQCRDRQCSKVLGELPKSREGAPVEHTSPDWAPRKTPNSKAGEAPIPPLSRWGGHEAVAMDTLVAWRAPPPQGHAFPLRWSLLIGRPPGRYHRP